MADYVHLPDPSYPYGTVKELVSKLSLPENSQPIRQQQLLAQLQSTASNAKPKLLGSEDPVDGPEIIVAPTGAASAVAVPSDHLGIQYDTDPLMSSKTHRNAISKLRSAGMTPQGEAFLYAALDPAHAKGTHPLYGPPDGKVGRKVISRCVQHIIRVVTPITNLSSDIHVYLTPLCQTEEQCRGYTLQDNVIQTTAQLNDGSSGMWNVVVVPSGTNTAPTPGGPLVAGGTYTADSVTALSAVWPFFPNNDILQGQTRIWGTSATIEDLTPALNQTGLSTSWRLGNVLTQQRRTHISPAATAFPTNYVDWRAAPPTLAQVANLPAVESWDSHQGNYIVGTINNIHNFDFKRPTSDLWFCRGQETAIGSDPTPIFLTHGCAIGPNLPNTELSINHRYNSFNSSGALLTGLPPGGVYNIKLVYLVELCPSDDSPFIEFADDPSPYDPIALAMYDQFSRGMPPSMIASANDMGAWFNTVANVVAKGFSYLHPLVQPAMKLVRSTGPMGSAIADGVETVDRIMDQILPASSKTAKKKNASKEIKELSAAKSDIDATKRKLFAAKSKRTRR